MKETRPFSMKDKIGYTLGDLGCCCTEQFRAMYLAIFYTLVLKVNPVHVGILMLVTKFWDAINDPLIGALVDSHKNKGKGKFIPWIKFFAFPTAVLCILGFVNVSNFAYGARIAYMFITYIVYEIMYTCVNVPFGSLSSVMTEGTNYRAKTRFAKFYNLPELMQMFREVADIQTADMLKLPVPTVNYHNIKTKPSEIQTEMVASLAKRAEKVRARLVEPNIDNMLKITNDGRKLALDQRMINPMLPDDPESKVNACVDNVYRIWEEHADTKATQLVFCDLSTPKNDGTFNVYDDMREKLIARGIPAEQIRFIHEATTDAQKKELFGKVRSGEVRVLFGSTPKMGAGTNVQDRLIAIHNLDCPWRPSDLEQRQGRIERQGNMFPEVEVYRYVTEQTFDAYLYQLVESKQKFISQIMTSKSPVRSAEDVDEVALSFAEVKMLATGDARFKEKMDLDIQVSKLRVLKQSYLSEHYDLEDRVLKYYPQTIKEYEERIAGYENDAALVEQHKPQGEDKFCPMTLKGMTYTEKADAGEMLLAICKDYPMSAATEIGSYRGFRIEIYYDTVNAHYCMNLCGKAKHKVDLGADALGNLTRIENELSKLPARLEAAKTKKAETIAQLETAKEEIKKPFAFEDELKEKTERLNALNIELNLNEKDTSVMDTEPEQAEEQPERKCASRER